MDVLRGVCCPSNSYTTLSNTDSLVFSNKSLTYCKITLPLTCYNKVSGWKTKIEQEGKFNYLAIGHAVLEATVVAGDSSTAAAEPVTAVVALKIIKYLN